MVVGFDKEATGAAGWVENRFSKAGINNFDHESDNGTRGIEFSGIACGIAHLFEHGFVQMAERMNLIRRIEVDAADLVDHISQKIPVDHAIDRAFEDGGDDITSVAPVRTLKVSQIGKEPRTFLPIRAHRFFIVDKGDKFITGDSVLFGCPIPPSVRRFDGLPELLPGHDGFLFAHLLQIIKKL